MKYLKWRCTSNPLGETAVMKAALVASLHDCGFYLGKHLLCPPCWVQVCSEAMCTWTWQCLECKSHTGTHDFLLFSPGKSNSNHQLVISKWVHGCTFFFFFFKQRCCRNLTGRAKAIINVLQLDGHLVCEADFKEESILKSLHLGFKFPE